MKPIPVTVISGFLGAGKTTAIIKLLGQVPDGEKWAVIINEFGKVSIDGHTIADSANPPADIYNITGGCICCSAERYFREDLEKIVNTGNFSRIIIEPSGLGGPEMISQAIKENPGLSLDMILCVVDILSIDNPRLQFNLIYNQQVKKAGAVVFSKNDLIESESEKNRLVSRFNEKFPGKTIITTTGPDLIDFISTNNNKPTTAVASIPQYHAAGNVDLSDRGFEQSSYSFSKETTVDIQKLSALLKNDPSVLRAKGHIRTGNQWYLFNYTVSGFAAEPCGEKESCLVIIISNRSGEQQNEAFLTGLEKLTEGKGVNPSLTSSYSL